jgi:5'-nucleotidase (lipoprotein e(P4) family)
MRRFPSALPLLALCVSACASASGSAAPAATTPATTPAAATIPLEVRWYRASAERRAIYLQTYRLAAAALERRAAGLAPGSWAVILDADETVLDNSRYQQRLAERHAAYDSASWNAWVRSEEATALPGAASFVARAHELGGKVVIVTNRDEPLCAATRGNLARVGLTADEVLCRADPAKSSKDPRFEAVAQGRAPSTLPPLRVVMWVGDNIQDFPGQSQALRTGPDSAFADFGHRFVVLPNPMYGSWEKNPLP